MDGDSCLADMFEDSDFGETAANMGGGVDDIFSILEAFENVTDFGAVNETSLSCKDNGEDENGKKLVSQKSISSSSGLQESENEVEAAAAAAATPKSKRQKLSAAAGVTIGSSSNCEDAANKMTHINVERNRRKQMNEHLSVLRSLMPCFYVKRGDQASIIGGVVDYITELQQVLQSLEAKKQRKVYSEVLSPRVLISSSPRPSPLSPRKPPLSPRVLNLPISPRTPQPTSPYMQRLHHQIGGGGYNLSPTTITSSPHEPSPSSSTSSSIDNVNELAANSKSAIADVEVKFSGANVLLKTVSPCIPGQALKIISAIEEDLSLEILHVNINTVDETMLNSFTIKIGIECQLSAEELAQQIQQTFCSMSKP